MKTGNETCFMHLASVKLFYRRETQTMVSVLSFKTRWKIDTANFHFKTHAPDAYR